MWPPGFGSRLRDNDRFWSPQGGGGESRIFNRGYSLAKLPRFSEGAKIFWLKPGSHLLYHCFP